MIDPATGNQVVAEEVKVERSTLAENLLLTVVTMGAGVPSLLSNTEVTTKFETPDGRIIDAKDPVFKK